MVRQVDDGWRNASDLEDGEEGLYEGVEVLARLLVGLVVVELATEQLHAEQREDDDEESQQQQQAGDRAHRVDERRHEVAQRRPVPTRNQRSTCTQNIVAGSTPGRPR